MSIRGNVIRRLTAAFIVPNGVLTSTVDAFTCLRVALIDVNADIRLIEGVAGIALAHIAAHEILALALATHTRLTEALVHVTTALTVVGRLETAVAVAAECTDGVEADTVSTCVRVAVALVDI